MIKNYKNGKIYKIEPIEGGEEEDIYIGSTCSEFLNQRLNHHYNDYKSYKKDKNSFVSSYILFDKYGFDNCNIILLETVEANTKNELLERESYYIKTLKCINKKIPLRTQKEWYDDNKDKIIKYRKDNKDKIKEYHKENYDNNKEKRKEEARQYRKNNKEIISEKSKIKITCECGSNVRKEDKARHYKSNKHLNYLKNIYENVK